MYFGNNNTGEFVNLYNQENPILESGDVCYCCVFTNDNFHRPLIVKGLIVKDSFVDGLNKIYYIRILEILESPKTIQKYFFKHPVSVYLSTDDNVVKSKTTKQITVDFDYNKNLFKVEAYFTRDSENKIRELRKEYISVVKQDLINMIEDIDGILL